ncbi:MAG: protoheme IX farnesyltransferase [Bacteroidales bacterium]
MLKLLLELNKIKIISAVTLTTLLGYVMAVGSIDSGAILPVLGILILAGGSAALNQYQEKDLDAQMERTKNRPLPSGKISLKLAKIIIIIEVVSGSLLLLSSSGILAMQLGLLALLWYNGIYTPLKRKSAYAVIPGAFIGAIPPAVGWVAGGGSLSDPQIIITAFFMFMWQIPHFWLLTLMHGKDYEKAGFPSLSARYNEYQLKRITFLWTLATAIACFFIPVFGIVDSTVQKILIGLTTLGLITLFLKLFSKSERGFMIKKYFIAINVFLLFIMIFIFIDKVNY